MDLSGPAEDKYNNHSSRYVFRCIQMMILIYCFAAYLVGTHWNCITEAVPVSNYKICFGAERMKIILTYCNSYHPIWRYDVYEEQCVKNVCTLVSCKDFYN